MLVIFETVPIPGSTVDTPRQHCTKHLAPISTATDLLKRHPH
jgi:hypothetical protein